MEYFALSDSNGIPLDKKLDELFGHKTDGFYIELGAFDGITQSNTYFFEKYRNWKGVLIEPSKDAFKLCSENRPNSIVINDCCVSNAYSQPYITGDFNSILMASVNGTRLIEQRQPVQTMVTVSASTLESILDDIHPQTIDLLSLDTEGYELDVLKGLNLDKYRPQYMLIEIYARDFKEISEFLASKNYRLHSNFSNYNRNDCPLWDGSHNDYLFESIVR